MRVFVILIIFALISLGYFIFNPHTKGNLNDKAPKSSSSSSWAYAFVVWNNRIYETTSDQVDKIGKEIGSIQVYSDEEIDTYGDNFSNTSKIGTKLFEILDTDPAIAIAVQNGDSYIKAVARND